MSSEILNATAAQLAKRIASGQQSSREITQAFLERIAAVEDSINAFISVDPEGALEQADAVDKKRSAGEQLGPLAGVPIGVKDLVCYQKLPTTAASHILQNWYSPYDATITKRLLANDLVIVGKTNLDEFAMGASTETSYFGVTRNPWDLSRTPGGSGGGSAAALAASEVPLAIGTDTGGSIRQPAAYTGTVAVKPTYGAVSRYGVIAMASSLDQPGPAGRNVEDTALLHAIIAGHDPNDSTSLNHRVPDVVAAARMRDISGMRIGVIKELDPSQMDDGVQRRFEEALELLENLGAQIVEVSCPHFPYALAAYHLIMPSEASSNLARYDGMRYGLRVGDKNDASVEQVMRASRDVGFGDEVKRRILIGTYALSSGFIDQFYGSALKVRTLIRQDFQRAYENVDVLLTPSTPTTAFKLGEKVDDPLAMYLSDLYSVPVNLSGYAGSAFPIGLSASDGMPVGIQVIAQPLQDDRLYRVGGALEAALEHRWGGRLLDQLPVSAGQEVIA